VLEKNMKVGGGDDDDDGDGGSGGGGGGGGGGVPSPFDLRRCFSTSSSPPTKLEAAAVTDATRNFESP
jgi:hypothetical protein